jgi:hypothetical protein
MDRKKWYTSATRQLVERATHQKSNKIENSNINNNKAGSSSTPSSKKNKRKNDKLLLEAKLRSSELSTSSDKTGVSFAGASFQANYYSTKFQRRGHLLYLILSDLRKKCHSFNLFPQTSSSNSTSTSSSSSSSSNVGTSSSSSSSCQQTQEEEKEQKEQQERRRNTVKVASIGGGPGTDAAGLLWIQKDFYSDRQFEVVLYDYEPSWKKYTKTLSDLLGPHIEPVTFHLCDVTQSLYGNQNYRNQKVDVSDTDLILFFYVCHETSQRQPDKTTLTFYQEVALAAKPNALVVIADVKTRSRQCLEQVLQTMSSVRTVSIVHHLSKGQDQYNSEVLAFRLV